MNFIEIELIFKFLKCIISIIFYNFGLESKVFTAFKGKKAKNDLRIQKYYKPELSNIDEMTWVAIR